LVGWRLSRILTALLVIAQVLTAIPTIASAEPATPVAPASTPPQPPPRVKVNRTVPAVTPPPSEPQFSSSPTTQEITRARVFSEPLIPVGGEPTAGENLVLARALLAYHRSGGTRWEPIVADFLLTHPASPWRASLLANLGTAQLRAHAYSLALTSWNEAWSAARNNPDPKARAVADFAVAQWLTVAASFGQIEAVEGRLAEIGERRIDGSAGVQIETARENVSLIKRHPERTMPCGPEALLALLAERNVAKPEVLTSYRPTHGSSTLTELQALATRAGMNLRMAERDGTADIPVPAVVHLKVSHYIAVVERQGDRYRVVDRRQTYWVSADTLDRESSGYALIPAQFIAGWRTPTFDEASAISGRGPVCPDGAPPPPPPCDPSAMCCLAGSGGGPAGGVGGDGGNCTDGKCGHGMTVYQLQAVTASLVLIDTPVGYTPPRGPNLQFSLSYHQRDPWQPQTFTFSNVGAKWGFDWLRFVKEEPADAFGITPALVWVAQRAGSREVYVNPDAQGVFGAHWASHAVLVRVSDSPVRYERRIPDGTVEVYALSDGAPAGQRRVFLTQLIDPRGQSVSLTWDAQSRLVAITDGIGQVTTISYEVSADPLKITKITDPFGRFATLTYNGAGQLQSITDVIGMSSAFAYGPNDFVSALTTPYGRTSFRHEPNAANAINQRFIEATDPLGGTEHLEFQWETPSLAAAVPSSDVPTGFTAFNTNLDHYNTFYWDKRAWMLGASDFSKATVTHWMVGPEWQGWQKYSYTAHSQKKPLESRIWYAYPNQLTGQEDTINGFTQPSRIGRRLDDGSSQLFETTYNDQGSVLTSTDPLGRRATFSYNTNGVDLLEVRQTTGSLNDLIATYSGFNSLHQPQSTADAAGEIATRTYNSAGQILTEANAKSETTTYTYDADGYLRNVTGPISAAVTSITYDGYGRQRTISGPDGDTATTDYDPLDRIVRVSYPDGTFEAWSYDRLDLSTHRNRNGHLTRYYYDALRRLTSIRDPLGRLTTLQWCGCGALEAIIDARGNRTSWFRDLQGRIIQEIRSNSSTVGYSYESTTSRLKQLTDALSQQTNYEYFQDDKVKQISYSNALVSTPPVSFVYEPNYGRLSSMTDSTGTTTYSYRAVATDGAGQLASVDGPGANDTVTYAYDALGRRVSRTLRNVTDVWAYDSLGRIIQQTDPIGTFVNDYDGTTDRLSQKTYPNGQTSTYSYFGETGDRRLQGIQHQTSEGETLSHFTYSYDAVGNITSWTQQLGVEEHAYDLSYDAASQLTNGVYRDTANPPAVLNRYGYTYDGLGNRTTQQVDDWSQTSIYDAMNRLAQEGGDGSLQIAGTVSEPAAVTIQGKGAIVGPGNQFTGSASINPGTTNIAISARDLSGNSTDQHFEVDTSSDTEALSYDLNGNLTASGNRTYEWDAANRLVRVSDGQTEVARFKYDGLGRRREKIINNSSRTYIYDGLEIILEEWSGGSVRHVLDSDLDRPLASVSDTGVITYYLADHLGSVVQQTDGSGEVSAVRRYDPYGRLLTGDDISGYAFTGREWDSEVDLYYFRGRYYSPELGRFISPDPVGLQGGINLYAYVDGNPIVNTDPLGLSPGGRGDRGKTGRPDGTDNEFKKMRPHPDPRKVWYKDKTSGKEYPKSKPDGFDEWWAEKHPQPRPRPNNPQGGGNQQNMQDTGGICKACVAVFVIVVAGVTIALCPADIPWWMVYAGAAAGGD